MQLVTEQHTSGHLFVVRGEAAACPYLLILIGWISTSKGSLIYANGLSTDPILAHSAGESSLFYY